MARRFVSIECHFLLTLRNLASPFFGKQESCWRRIGEGLRGGPIPAAAASILILLSLTPTQAFPADTLRVVSYNLLNYPGTSSSIRNPEFRKSLRRIDPDVAVVQEMTSQAGMNEFLAQVLNVIAPGRYVSVPFNDGPDTDNGLFYDSSRVKWISASYIPTALRNIAEYVLRVRSSGDTMRIYSLHLKASSGAANEEDRRLEATILRNHLNTLPTGSLFIVVGDYNIYRSSEPAFVKLLQSETDNDGRCFDQLNLVGTWNAPQFAPYHTQSPRVRAFDGGSTGGMDDRFDIILSSDAMRNHLLTSSITAFGNDGNHYNDSINRLPNAAVPDSIANALHNASDHLPVYGDIVFTTLPAAPPIAATDSATGVSPTAMTLNGRVNPGGGVTTVRFAWGRGSSLADTTAPQFLNPDTVLIAVSATLSGLTADTSYSFRVVASNAGGSAQGSVRSVLLPPVPPPTPSLVSPAPGAEVPQGSVSLVWRAASGASAYQVQVCPSPAFTPPFAADTTLADTSLSLAGLQVGEPYFWRVRAANGGGSSSYSLARLFTVSNAVTGQFAVSAGWNLLSLPYTVASPMRGTIYPQATSPAYVFSPESGYVENDSLGMGKGFWLKFDADQQVSITGVPFTSDTIAVQAGWNLVGAISSPVDVGSVTSNPPDLVASSFFQYSGTYTAAETLLPGQAYWVKASGTGFIVIRSVLSTPTAAPR